ncbi:MFS transporter [Streptomyces sp. MUM 16J]|uniref:MFS transporter n=1 Tax=Streptomyces sp. MUM 16J TaxID=2791988 RepID=UPI001F03A4BC
MSSLPSPAPSAVRRRLILLTLCVSLFMAMLDNTVVNTALPTIERKLGAGISDLQWIVDGYSLALSALMLTASTVGDMFGRRRAFVAGLALFAVGSTVCALSRDVNVLISGRVLQGAGAAAFMPGTLSIIRQVYADERERSTAIGIWAGVSGLGLGLGPLVGGPLVDHFGWPSVFWINVPVGMAGVIAGMLLIPESKDRAGRGLDITGQLLAVAGIGAGVYATIEGPVRGWSDPAVTGLYIGAGVVLLLFVLVERRSRTPMLDLDFFRDRIFAGSVLAGLFLYLGMFSVLYFLSLWLQVVLGWSPTGAGLVIMPAMVVVACVTPLAGWLTGRIGGGWPMAAGLVCSAFALYGLTRYGTGASYRHFWWLLPVIGMGMGLTITPITATVLDRVPAARAGMASAVSNTARELGGVLGVAVLGSVLSSRMAERLRERLTAAGVPASERDRLVAATTGGTGRPQAGLGAGARLSHAVNGAFVDGLHLAELSGCAILLAGALLAVALVRGGRGPAPGSRGGKSGELDTSDAHDDTDGRATVAT